MQKGRRKASKLLGRHFTPFRTISGTDATSLAIYKGGIKARIKVIRARFR